MKILIAADTYPPHVNGAALAAERLAEALAQIGHEVFVIAASSSFRNAKTKNNNLTIYRLRSIPSPINKFQKIRLSLKPFHVKKMHEIIMQVKPDIIHVFETIFIGLTAIEIARKEHIPVIASHHLMPENFTDHLYVPEQVEWVVNYALWKWYTYIYKYIDYIICPTKKAASIVSLHSKHTKIEVISNGINIEKFNPQNNGDYLKQRYKLPNKTTLLFLGRLDKEKNIDILIKAIGILKKTIDFHTIIVGKGKESSQLKELAAKLGVLQNITFTGYLPRKDLSNIYKTADIFVMPGIAELQSIVTMEAMASGLPIVGANAVALPELIQHDVNGFLFIPGNEDDCAKQLDKLIKNKSLRIKMGNESRKVIKKHDMNKVVTLFENTYIKVINNYDKTQETTRKSPILQDLKKINLIRFVNQGLQNKQ